MIKLFSSFFLQLITSFLIHSKESLVSFTNDLLNLFSSTRPSKCPHKFPHQLKKFFLLKSVLHLLLPNDVSASFLTSLHIIGESPPFYPLPFTLSTTFLIFFSVPRFKLQNSFPTPIYTLSHTYPTKNLINLSLSSTCHQRHESPPLYTTLNHCQPFFQKIFKLSRLIIYAIKYTFLYLFFNKKQEVN